MACFVFRNSYINESIKAQVFWTRWIPPPPGHKVLQDQCFSLKCLPEAQGGWAWEGPQWLIPEHTAQESLWMYIPCSLPWCAQSLNFQRVRNPFSKQSLRPPGAESFFLPTHHTKQSSRFFYKIRISWLLHSPCCCSAKFSAEELLYPLTIPTDTERWTCEKREFCQGLFPFLTDIL